MREKGRYYQPDHWTSYQFPAGQAREPILGVRHSDAVVFCEWLTWHELSGWEYRLPTQKETGKNPVKSFEQKTLGHWIGKKFEFAWISTVYNNARALAFDRTYVSEYVYSPKDNKVTDNLEPFLNSAGALDLDLARNNLPPTMSEYTQEFAVASERAIPRVFPSHSALAAARLGYDVPICVDIFTLRERIAGRSPAFEGIRLVKERIR